MAISGRIPEVVEAKKVEVEFIGGVRINPNLVAQEARRLKYEHLLWKVIAEGDVFYTIRIKVVKTEPKGEVQITPRTVINISDKNILHES
ncbi:hypothetical protein DRO69_14340 [Candidatus Bathyarchaeota archaeon]|nr:MAG: hypothetical protein DRO69_14340 [Candidatus Bathyarchaeota archaeon]